MALALNCRSNLYEYELLELTTITLLSITWNTHYHHMFENDLCKPTMFAHKWVKLCSVTNSQLCTYNVSRDSHFRNYINLFKWEITSVLLHSTKMRLLCLSLFSLLLFFLHKTEAEISGRTFGSCDTLRCMLDQGQASYCCNSGRNRRYVISIKMNLF